MTRTNVIVTVVTLAVAGALVASCAHFGIGNTFMGVLIASAIVAPKLSAEDVTALEGFAI